MAAWYEQLDSVFGGLTDSVTRPTTARKRRGVDRLFGRMLDQLHAPDPEPEQTLPPVVQGKSLDSAEVADPRAGQRPALGGFNLFRRYGGVVIADGDDPYAEMSAADHEIEYAE